MNTIREIFSKPIDRTIEEVIKVEQTDNHAVLTELHEYVMTDFLQDQFGRLFEEIASGPANPCEGIGIWISGFFGSGKSLFAKLLGYAVAARAVGDKKASDLLKAKFSSPKTIALLDSIVTRIKFKAVIFDVPMNQGSRDATARLTPIMYKVLLRELDYAEDFDLAELEIALEADSKLDDFMDRFEARFKKPWKKRRDLGLARNEASAILCEMDPKTYPSPDSYAKSPAKADIDPNKLAERAHDLAGRRCPDHALIFIIDEVGQYISRSVDKMLDLQSVIQAFGIEGKNRMARRQAVSPYWIAVTSQEKLNEVVTALDSKKVELAKLQDRFRLMVDLKQSDITEITAKRVLDKTPAAKTSLTGLFDANEGRLSQLARPERTSRDVSISKEDFVKVYPYLPYQMDLSIDIVAGLRLRRGAQLHVGGSNRTIIKQAQQVMLNPRTRLADAPIGNLVTLDQVYELLSAGSLIPNEVSHEIDDAERNLSHIPMAPRVAKAIALLEAVKDFPRTPHNLAVVLFPSVTSDSILSEVQIAIEALEKAQIIRNSEDGYKLLTVEEKSWETRRNGLDPREADRNRIKQKTLQDIFTDPKMRSYRYEDLRAFRPSLTIEGQPGGVEGEIPVNVLLAESAESRPERLDEARSQSNLKREEVFWVVSLTDEIHANVVEVFRSRNAIEEAQQPGHMDPATAGSKSTLVAEERNREERYLAKLRTGVSAAVQTGVGFFRGVQYEATSLGLSLPDILSNLFDRIIPELYPNLEIGALSLSGKEASQLLAAVNLSGLPQVFYDSKDARSLIIKQGDKHVPNQAADLCQEILVFLRKEHEYGNKVTGKDVERRFSGMGYGWLLDAIRLGVAVLFRAGALEITWQNHRYTSYTEPASRQVFENVPAFRNASYSPQETLDLKILSKAAQAYEDLTGKDASIDMADLDKAFKEIAGADRAKLLSPVAQLKALKAPGAGILSDFLERAETILEMAAEDCVKTLAREGKSYKHDRKKAEQLIASATEQNLAILDQGRRILSDVWPQLAERGGLEIEDWRLKIEDVGEAADQLTQKLHSEDALLQVEAIRQCIQPIASAYDAIQTRLLAQRQAAYEAAVDMVKGLPEWAAICEDQSLTPEQRASFLRPLVSRCEATQPPPRLSEIETELSAVEPITGRVILGIRKFLEPEERIERFKVAQHWTAEISSETELNEAMAALRDKLSKLLAQGFKVVLE